MTPTRKKTTNLKIDPKLDVLEKDPQTQQHNTTTVNAPQQQTKTNTTAKKMDPTTQNKTNVRERIQ